VVLAGFVARGISDSQSDYDLYVYSRHPVNVAFRENPLRPQAQRLDLHRTFWEDEDAWIEPDAIEFQIMYRSCAWTEGDLSARLDRCEATLGYTTAICYSIERSRTLWDRSGWFARMLGRLLQGYPERLARAVVQKNLPVLGAIISSYEQQIQAGPPSPPHNPTGLGYGRIRIRCLRTAMAPTIRNGSVPSTTAAGWLRFSLWDRPFRDSFQERPVLQYTGHACSTAQSSWEWRKAEKVRSRMARDAL
jgi:hypothetical protein